MRNPKMMKRVSVKCAAAIMTAVMTMSPVAGAVAMPLVAYAEHLPNNPSGTSVDIGPDDDMDVNNGTIGTNAGHLGTNAGVVTENTGTVENNSGTVTTNIGTVNNNSGQVTDNYGTVNNTSTQPEGTVGTNHINSRVTGGNTTDNYGNVTNGDVTNNYSGGMVTDNSATVCVVQNNYGTVNGADNVTYNVGSVTGVASVYDNYGTATDCGVDINYLSGTVQGNSTVTQNLGGRLLDGINPTNPNQSADAGTPPTPAAGRATDPTGNPYVAPQAPPVQTAIEPEPEQESGSTPESVSAPQKKQLNLNGIKNNPYANDPGASKITEALMGDRINSANGGQTAEIIIDFGTNTGINATMLEALLTYNPDEDDPVKKPIFLAFTIDGLTYYLRVDRNDKQLTGQIMESRLQGGKEGPMKIAELFGDYGITLVPGADAVRAHMDLVTKEVDDISDFSLKKTLDHLENLLITPLDFEDKINNEMAVDEKTMQNLLLAVNSAENTAAIDQAVAFVQAKVDRYNESVMEQFKALNEQYNGYNKTLENMQNRRVAAEEKLKAVQNELQVAKAGSINKDAGAVKVIEEEVAVLESMIDTIHSYQGQLLEAYLIPQLTALLRISQATDEKTASQTQLDTIEKAAAERKKILALSSPEAEEAQNAIGAEQYGAAAAEQDTSGSGTIRSIGQDAMRVEIKDKKRIENF